MTHFKGLRVTFWSLREEGWEGMRKGKREREGGREREREEEREREGGRERERTRERERESTSTKLFFLVVWWSIL